MTQRTIGIAIGMFLVLASALFAVLLVTRNQQAQQNIVTNNQPTYQELQTGEVANINQVQLAGSSYNLPSGWELSLILTSENNTDYECITTPASTSCNVQLVTNQSGQIPYTIALSTSQQVRLALQGDLPTGEEQFTFGSELVVLKAEYATLLGPDLETELGKLPLQVYGCDSKGICVQAGPFSNQPEANQQQLIELRSFLQQLT